MLFGPGGIVALLLGGWSALWALENVPGRSWRQWGPTATLFVGAMVAFALLTAAPETVLSLLDWIKDPDLGEDLLADAVAMPCRPVRGLVVGIGVLAVAAAWATSNAPPKEPEPEPVALEVGFAFVVTCLAVTGLVALALLRFAISGAGDSLDDQLAALPWMRRLTGIGVASAIGIFFVIGVAGTRTVVLARRARREPEAAA